MIYKQEFLFGVSWERQGKGRVVSRRPRAGDYQFEHKDLEKLVYPVDRWGVDRWGADSADSSKSLLSIA